MGKLYDLAVKTGEYLKDGQKKGRYENVGAMWESKNGGGPYITLRASFNPAGITRKEGSDSIFLSCFEPRENGRLVNDDRSGGEKWQNPDGSMWTQQDNGNWTKDQPQQDNVNMSMKFSDGPAGMNETAEIPF